MNDQHDNPVDIKTQIEGGTGVHLPNRNYIARGPDQEDHNLRSDAFEAAWGRAVRDIYTSDVDIIKAMYDACVIGWQAGFEYGQQS